MSIIRTLSAAWPAVDARPIHQIEQEIVDELDFHIAMRTEENIREGLAPQAARHAALSKFGNFAAIHHNCRRTLLGERIMWQRFQIGLTILLLAAVGFLADQLYSSQQENADALERLQQTLRALTIEPTEAQTSSLEAPPSSEAPVSDWRLERPMVMETIPKTGDQAVDSNLAEIRVKYNKPMADQSWSWVQMSESTFPKSTGEVHYDTDEKTCVMPVKLEPGRQCIIWFNSANFQNFKDSEGRPAAPYLLKFATAPKQSE